MSILGNDLLLAGTDEGYNLTRSLRFRSSASAYLNRTIGTPTNNKIFTVSFWVKRGLLSSRQGLIGATNSGASNYWMVEFDAGNNLTVYDAYASGTTALTTTQVFRDPSAWYHIVVAVDTTQATGSNRTKVYVNGSQVTSFSVTNYPTQNSNTYFNTSSAVASVGSWNPYSIPYYFDGYLTEVNFIDGQALTPSSFGSTNATTGVWQPARYTGTYGTNGFYLPFSTVGGSTYAASFNGSNQSLYGTLASSIGTGNFTVEMWVNPTTLSNYNSWFGITRGAGGFNVGTDAAGTLVFYSSSARQIDVAGVIAAGRYTHIAFVRNGTTLKGYVNGVAVATATVSTNFSATTFYIGSLDNSVEFNNGLISNLRVTNTAVYTANFTPPSVALTAISGTMLLTLQSSTIVDNSGNAITINNVNSVSTSTAYPFVVTLGSDASGNNNNWATNNISLTPGTTYDSMTDVPTLTSETAANFCTLNPLNSYAGLSQAGNLQANNSAAIWETAVGTMFASSGKFYAEMTVTSAVTNVIAGIVSPSVSGLTSKQLGIDTAMPSYGYTSNGNLYFNGTFPLYGASYTNGDVIGVALDLNAGTLTFYKNNVSQGTAATGLSGLFSFATSCYQGNVAWNFGQRPFSYTPPSGFKALNTFNLPTSTIVAGNKYMDALLWTGNGAASQNITSGNFQPDFAWLKCRSTVDSNNLVNSVTGGNKVLQSNNTNAEVTASMVDAWLSNGITANLNENVSGRTYVGWLWQAGQGTTSTNTSGTITSTVSVNASAGFSVVTYTGTGVNATVGHGLGVAPALVIVKARNQAYNWNVYSSSLANTQFLRLNTTDSVQAGPTLWNSTSPTSSVFSIGTSLGVNGSGDTHVAYCWTPIAGYSAFGSYTGNGSTDGPFIYTGFRPKFVMCKVISTSNWWIMFDSTRNPYNAANYELAANLSDAEYTANTSQYTLFDFLSNGFKLRTGSLEGNSNGQTYIYMAFAENPFKNALAR